jgi:hypothetical protein
MPGIIFLRQVDFFKEFIERFTSQGVKQLNMAHLLKKLLGRGFVYDHYRFRYSIVSECRSPLVQNSSIHD